MGLFPEHEPRKNKYENPDEASPLNIERKEVVTPVATQFKAKVVSDDGQKLTESVEDKKFTIKVPEISQEAIEEKVKKGNKEESSTWLGGYWFRIIKKALYFGWKVVFDK